MTIEWVQLIEIYNFTKVVLNDLHTNLTTVTVTYQAGVDNSGDIGPLTPNTPYSITVTSVNCQFDSFWFGSSCAACFSRVVQCTDANILVESDPASITAYSNAQRPVLALYTTPEQPPTISVDFYLPLGVSNYSFSLERDANDLEMVTNPYKDSDLEPATMYAYTGKRSVSQWLNNNFWLAKIIIYRNV